MESILKYTFFLFFSVTCFGQNSIISKYEKADIDNSRKLYSEMLGINSSDALILKIESFKFIVFGKNDSIYSYETTSDYKVLVKQKIPSQHYSHCLQYLDSLKTIDPSNLNFTEKKNMGKDVPETIKVEDGLNYKIELFKKNVTVEYVSYSPEIYIEYKFPFYKERLRLLNAYNYYISLFGKNEKINNLPKHKKLYNYFKPLSCKEIIEGIADSELYKIVDGRFIFKEDFDKSKMFKVTVNDGNIYYVSKRLKKKIKHVIKKENCLGIKIEKNSLFKT